MRPRARPIHRWMAFPIDRWSLVASGTAVALAVAAAVAAWPDGLVVGLIAATTAVGLVVATVLQVSIVRRGRAADAVRRTVAQLEHEARYDRLTELPNRWLIHEQLGQAIAAAEAQDGSAALLLLDLDRFKDVNDTFGHQYGDLLLCRMAERIPALLRAGDSVGRLGGDEFAVVLPGGSLDTASQVAARLVAELEQPVEVEGQVLEVGATIGVVAYPQHGTDADTLLRQADVAMYAAKDAHADVLVYSPELDEHSPDRLALVSELRRAIEGGDLVLHYQPLLDYETRTIKGVEALARWQHPARGMVPPGDFIPLAERTGLIGPLTTWVLRAAVRQCAEWRAAGLDLRMAVNLSQRNLADPDLPDAVAALLAEWNVPASRLVLEVTESTLMSDPKLAIDTTERLRAMGIILAIDDFGTGYSSLAHLSRLPVEELKIDRSFVQQMAADSGDSAIVRSTISLAHELGLRIVAEGVEDEDTLILLQRLGADVAQGFFISRPLPPDGLVAWLADAAFATPRFSVDSAPSTRG
jgi:diguanylate cyclase (GGDEF)-like protein